MNIIRLAIVTDGVVSNVILADRDAIPPEYADLPAAPDHVGRGFTWDGTAFSAPAPAPVAPEMVRVEAARRIEALCPAWKQRNMLADLALLSLRDPSERTPEDQARWQAVDAVWARIADIRAASNALEAQDPIPQDFVADRHWP